MSTFFTYFLSEFLHSSRFEKSFVNKGEKDLESYKHTFLLECIGEYIKHRYNADILLYSINNSVVDAQKVRTPRRVDIGGMKKLVYTTHVIRDSQYSTPSDRHSFRHRVPAHLDKKPLSHRLYDKISFNVNKSIFMAVPFTSNEFLNTETDSELLTYMSYTAPTSHMSNHQSSSQNSISRQHNPNVNASQQLSLNIRYIQIYDTPDFFRHEADSSYSSLSPSINNRAVHEKDLPVIGMLVLTTTNHNYRDIFDIFYEEEINSNILSSVRPDCSHHSERDNYYTDRCSDGTSDCTLSSSSSSDSPTRTSKPIKIIDIIVACLNYKPKIKNVITPSLLDESRILSESDSSKSEGHCADSIRSLPFPNDPSKDRYTPIETYSDTHVTRDYAAHRNPDTISKVHNPGGCEGGVCCAQCNRDCGCRVCTCENGVSDIVDTIIEGIELTCLSDNLSSILSSLKIFKLLKCNLYSHRTCGIPPSRPVVKADGHKSRVTLGDCLYYLEKKQDIYKHLTGNQPVSISSNTPSTDGGKYPSEIFHLGVSHTISDVLKFITDYIVDTSSRHTIRSVNRAPSPISPPSSSYQTKKEDYECPTNRCYWKISAINFKIHNRGRDIKSNKKRSSSVSKKPADQLQSVRVSRPIRNPLNLANTAVVNVPPLNFASITTVNSSDERYIISEPNNKNVRLPYVYITPFNKIKKTTRRMSLRDYIAFFEDHMKGRVVIDISICECNDTIYSCLHRPCVQGRTPHHTKYKIFRDELYENIKNTFDINVKPKLTSYIDYTTTSTSSSDYNGCNGVIDEGCEDTRIYVEIPLNVFFDGYTTTYVNTTFDSYIHLFDKSFFSKVIQKVSSSYRSRHNSRYHFTMKDVNEKRRRLTKTLKTKKNLFCLRYDTNNTSDTTSNTSSKDTCISISNINSLISLIKFWGCNTDILYIPEGCTLQSFYDIIKNKIQTYDHIFTYHTNTEFTNDIITTKLPIQRKNVCYMDVFIPIGGGDCGGRVKIFELLNFLLG